MANFGLRPGNASASNNALNFLESALENLGVTRVGLFRAHSGSYDKTIIDFLVGEDHPHRQRTPDAGATANHGCPMPTAVGRA